MELRDVCKSAPVKIRTDGGVWENENTDRLRRIL